MSIEALEMEAVMLASLANLAISLYIFYRQPRSIIHRSFLVFGIGTVLWGGGLGLLTPDAPLLLVQVIFLGAGVVGLGIFLLSCTLERQSGFLRGELVAIMLFVPLIAGIPLGWYVVGLRTVGSNFMPVFGPYGLLYLAAVAAYMIWGFARLVQTCLALERSRRTPFYYFFLGAGIFIVSFILFDEVIPVMGFPQVNLLGPIALLPFVGTTAYAIVRHNLLDIRIIIQRGLIYTSLLGLIVGCYVLVINGVGFLFGTSMNNILLSAVATTIVGIFTVPKIEQYFRWVTDKIFFKDTYDYADVLQRLSEALHRNMEFGAMSRQAREVLNETFHPETISLEDTGKISLGPKRSGEVYTIQDDHLLTTFSHQAATAFERARLFGQVTEHAAELEQKVKERTKELRETQEEQKQMMLDISHGLQTPLAVFQTKLEQLKQTVPDDTEIEHLEVSLADLSNFIYNLLKLARLENNREEITLAPVCLTSLLEEVVEEVEIIAVTHDISIWQKAALDIYVNGDAKKIRDVVMNLTSNSIKYMRPNSKKEIVFSLITEGEMAILSVSDSGIGITTEDMPYIFERFYRVQHSPGRINGSGLGLAISKHIVEQHGGTIGAESEFGKGTTITIRLPTAR